MQTFTLSALAMVPNQGESPLTFELIAIALLALSGAAFLNHLFRSKATSQKGVPGDVDRANVIEGQHEQVVVDEMDRLRNVAEKLEAQTSELRKREDELKAQLAGSDQAEHFAHAAVASTPSAPQAPDPAPAPVPTPAPAPAPVSQAASSLEQTFAHGSFARELVDAVMSATAENLADGQGREPACLSYSNDPAQSLKTLFESEIDRFWLAPNPKDPDEALLLPGLHTKINWPYLRKAVADHPLLHHFDLLKGERFEVIKPALLRKGDDGGWHLEERGRVRGVAG